MTSLERLGFHLTAYENSGNLNDARKVGEAVCKVVLEGSDKPEVVSLAEEGRFQKLIDSLSKRNLSIREGHIKKIRSDLGIIQDLGNIDSHDNEIDIIGEVDKAKVAAAVKSVLKNVFDAREYIDLDCKVPNNILRYIDKSVVDEENWKCEKIVALVYPNRDISRVSDHRDYDFYIVREVNETRVGFVFFGRNISFKAAVKDLFDNHGESVASLTSLSFLFPKEISKVTGKEVRNRKKSIRDKANKHTSRLSRVKFSFDFIEDYIWNNCLTDNLKKSSGIREEPYYTDQWLHQGGVEILSLNFIEELTTRRALIDEPINLILGDGGVGKTTFCEQAAKKIDEMLASGSKKKAIILSSYDLPEDVSLIDRKVDSIQSLYALLNHDGSDEVLDPQNLALNISSGNLVILIDGLDEIESRLKENFDVDSFFLSVVGLNSTYLNCSVVITSRVMDADRYRYDGVKVYNLKGFNDGLVQKYLEVRYPGESQRKIYENVLDAVDELSLKEEKTISPLIVRLLCEHYESNDNFQDFSLDAGCKYFIEGSALDAVVYQIIDRDIEKQTLGVSCDSYYEIIRDVVFDYNGKISISDFDELLKYTIESSGGYVPKDFENFYVFPLFNKCGGVIEIKYDSLIFWIKARNIGYEVYRNDGGVIGDSVGRVVARECYAGGALVESVSKDYYDCDFPAEKIKDHICKLSFEGVRSDVRRQKQISGILYLVLYRYKDNKDECTSSLVDIYSVSGDSVISGLFIFGPFYPVDFRGLEIRDSVFVEFSNMSKCSFPDFGAVFFDCEFKGIDTKGFGRKDIKKEYFQNCSLGDDLNTLIDSGEFSVKLIHENVKKDLKKIFGVGYKKSVFVWKSEQLYKQQCASLKHSYSLKQYLDFLVKNGFYHYEQAKGSSGRGYRLSEEMEVVVKSFITQRISNPEIKALIKKIAGC